MNSTQNKVAEARLGEGAATPRAVEMALAGHPFLKGLTPHQCRLLSDCAMLVKYQPGELIFREGDPANRFYLILKGKVAVESYVRGQGITTVQKLDAGDVLGWSWLFPPFYWHFDARAVTETEAIFFYGTPLRAECEADHDLGYELMKRTAEIMMQRLQAGRRQLLELPPQTVKTA